ncbi:MULTISPECIES: hypothetical protein [unclassified Oceanobacter]|uniref:hypothetical protein n=1 Tax=unclassified Oceanobacter TaxID=2620260 RepID=UPI002735EE75|nr:MULTISPECIES: hypothetical protein [unclassified Oceanobacter]MDP2609194.1 hypothetical protein [Oceanobacter sp. 1_MG-2023]MDP2612514.1 hypothetical protein [Oceanobacter sp. 2_MG-2023]
MIEQWQPASSQTGTPDSDTLQQLLAALPTAQEATVINSDQLDAGALKTVQSWIKLDEAAWQAALTAMDTDQLLPLAAFFASAEQQLEGWHCGSSNPAIWIFRYLKKQGTPASREQVRAIKALTDNRYIPHGSAL